MVSGDGQPLRLHMHHYAIEDAGVDHDAPDVVCTTCSPASRDAPRAANPKRVQRTRTKGGGMPAGAAYVGRPTEWGNPFRPGDDHPWYPAGRVIMSRQDAVDLFALHIGAMGAGEYDQDKLGRLRELAGRDLACWCPTDAACHADVLLDLANQAPR